jgi:putative ABC transport system permease protein
MSGERLFRALLRLLPFDFRADYGSDIERVFRHERNDARGRRGAVRVWLRTLIDRCRIGPGEHLLQLRQDLRYAIRGMHGQPELVAAAILTLGVGVGANTAIFSVVHAVLLRPLPYAEPNRLVAVWNRWTGRATAGLSDPECLDYSERSRTLDIAAGAAASVNVAGGTTEPERISAGFVTVNALGVLGISPAIGRDFRRSEEVEGRDRVAILSHSLWRRRFGAAPSVLGRTLDVNGARHEIIGVMGADSRVPMDFGSDTRTEILLPLPLDRSAPRARRGGHYLQGFARLQPGANALDASAEMDAIVGRLIAEYPDEHDQGAFGVVVRPLRDDLLGDARPVLAVLAGAVALVLLLACANVANLLLARGEARSHELAVRAALGASRLRLMRQLLTESLVLSAAGATVGVAFAAWSQKVMVVLAAGGTALPRLDEIGLAGPVLVFAAALTVVNAMLFGIIPAFQLSRGMGLSLAEGVRWGTPARRARTTRTLVISQVAIAVVLSVAAALLIRSLERVLAIPAGIRTDHVLTFRVSLPDTRYPDLSAVSGFYTRLLARLRALPHVEHVGASTGLPLAIASGDWSFDIEGRPRVNGRHPGAADWYVTTPGYFEAMRIRLVRGRFPAESDDEHAARVVFLNETTARTLFAGVDPVGRRIRLTSTTGGEQPWRTIAGVVGDVRQRGLDTPPRPEMFVPYRQFQHFSAGVQAWAMTIVMKTAGDPLHLVPALRAELHALDPLVPAAQIRNMDAVVSLSVADRRLSVALVGTFGVLALVLASIGLYGVMAYNVGQRTREIGLRVAIGASRRSVLGLVIGQALRLVTAGLAIGVTAAILLGGTLAELLFEVNPRDATVLAGVALLLGAVGVAASYVPALRAMRIDPISALRME